MNGKHYLPLQGGERGTTNIQIQHEIRFGNSPLICRVTNLNINDDDDEEEAQQKSIIIPTSMNEIETGGDTNRVCDGKEEDDSTINQTTQDETAHTNKCNDGQQNE
jgi:hypothetical protein